MQAPFWSRVCTASRLPKQAASLRSSSMSQFWKTRSNYEKDARKIQHIVVITSQRVINCNLRSLTVSSKCQRERSVWYRYISVDHSEQWIKGMSFVAETGDGGSVSSLSDTAHEVHSSRTSASSHQDVDLGEGSESESYVEVEQLGEDSAPGPSNFSNLTSATSPALSPPCNTARHITKRTLITLHQRSVLEEYYRNGMTSASQQLTEVHEIVAEKTGLDLAVVRVSYFSPHKCRPRYARRVFTFFGFNGVMRIRK